MILEWLFLSVIGIAKIKILRRVWSAKSWLIIIHWQRLIVVTQIVLIGWRGHKQVIGVWTKLLHWHWVIKLNVWVILLCHKELLFINNIRLVEWLLIWEISIMIYARNRYFRLINGILKSVLKLKRIIELIRGWSQERRWGFSIRILTEEFIRIIII